MLIGAAQRLALEQVQGIVLAQASMAHLVPEMKSCTGLPVFSSLETSLVEVRKALGDPSPASQ